MRNWTMVLDKCVNQVFDLPQKERSIIADYSVSKRTH